MAVTVDLLEEIRDRIATAISSGTLTDVKRFRVGNRQEARKDDDFPVINLAVKDAVEELDSLKSQFTTELTIEIALITNKKSDLSNSLYKISDTSGPIYLLDKLLDVLDNNTSDVLDLSFNSKSRDLREISYRIEETALDLIELVVDLKVRTIAFTAGSR